MKKVFNLTILLAACLFASNGMAATASFWASTIQSDSAMDPYFLKEGYSKKVAINYELGSNWTINSAKFWLRAVDDYKGSHCSKPDQDSKYCLDDNKSKTPQDPNEYAKVTSIEGVYGTYGSAIEINNFKWYDLNINVASYLNNTDKIFNATIKAICGDFWYKNAKLVVDYDIKEVPVPAALWLFGSALLGLTGLKRKTAPAVVG